MFMSALIATAATSCNKDDESSFDSSITTTPSGYVSEIKYTRESSNDNGEKEYETGLSTFTYDSEKRVKEWTYYEAEALDNGGSKVSTDSALYYYEDNTITVCIQGETVYTTYEIEENTLVSSVNTDYRVNVFVAELDSNDMLLSVKWTHSAVDSDGSSYSGMDLFEYESFGDKISSYTRTEDDDTSITVGVAAWQGDNMKLVDDNVFTFSTMPNNQNIDLNMFVTRSEAYCTYLQGDNIGILNEVKGIHSANMISSCAEEGWLYDVLYVTDSDGRITQAKWSKFSNGYYDIIDVSYYE